MCLSDAIHSRMNGPGMDHVLKWGYMRHKVDSSSSQTNSSNKKTVSFALNWLKKEMARVLCSPLNSGFCCLELRTWWIDHKPQ
jgi:hypothetical protein